MMQDIRRKIESFCSLWKDTLMRCKPLHIFFFVFLLLFSTSSCSWLPNASPKNEDRQIKKADCLKEGYLFLKGTEPNVLPVLQNGTGQWRLTGNLPKKIEKFHRQKVRVQGECPAPPLENAWLLPEIRVFQLDIPEKE